MGSNGHAHRSQHTTRNHRATAHPLLGFSLHMHADDVAHSWFHASVPRSPPAPLIAFHLGPRCLRCNVLYARPAAGRRARRGARERSNVKVQGSTTGSNCRSRWLNIATSTCARIMVQSSCCSPFPCPPPPWCEPGTRARWTRRSSSAARRSPRGRLERRKYDVPKFHQWALRFSIYTTFLASVTVFILIFLLS